MKGPTAPLLKVMSAIFFFSFFFFSSVIPPLYEIYGQAWNAQAAGSASHPGLWKASYGALGRAEDGKGKGGEVVSSWFRLAPDS